MSQIPKNPKAAASHRRRATKTSIEASPVDIPRVAHRIVTRSYARQLISAAAAEIPVAEIRKGIAAAKKSPSTAAAKKPATSGSARSARRRPHVAKKTPTAVAKTKARKRRRRVVVPTKKQIQMKKLRDATKKKLDLLGKHGRKALRDRKKLPDKKTSRPKTSK